MQPNQELTRIVFWNVNRKDLTKLVCSIAITKDTDVLVLNETSVSSDDTLRALRKEVAASFYVPPSSPESRFHCFCRNPGLDLSEVHSGFRTSVRNFQIGTKQTLLALVHGVDMRNYDSESRQSFAQSLATEIRFVKEQQKTNRLLMLGDFNMNPYDRGMNLAPGINAMMTRTCVATGARRHLNESYDFYYNPMWSLFGDNTPGPAGTIYDTSNQGPYGWSMLDQVVFNSSIVDLFSSVEILTTAGKHTLMDQNGRPNRRNASNHFPILVNLKGKSG